MNRLQHIAWVAGFAVLVGCWTTPAQGQFRQVGKKGSAQQGGGAGKNITQQMAAGMGAKCQKGGNAKGSNIMMQSPFGQGGMMMQSPFGQNCKTQMPFGQSAMMQSPFGQSGMMQMSFGQSAMMQSPFGQNGMMPMQNGQGNGNQMSAAQMAAMIQTLSNQINAMQLQMQQAGFGNNQQAGGQAMNANGRNNAAR